MSPPSAAALAATATGPLWLIDGTLVARRFCAAGKGQHFTENLCRKLWAIRLIADTVRAKPLLVLDSLSGESNSWRKEHLKEYKKRVSWKDEREREIFVANLNLVRRNFLPYSGIPLVVAENGLEGDDVLAKLAVEHEWQCRNQGVGVEHVEISEGTGDQQQLGAPPCSTSSSSTASSAGSTSSLDAANSTSSGKINAEVQQQLLVPTKNQTVVFSTDKDLFQLLPYGIDIVDPFTFDPIDEILVEHKFGLPADRIAEMLAISGDSSDCITAGAKGFGPHKFRQLFQNVKPYETLAEILDRQAIKPPKIASSTAKTSSSSGTKRGALNDIDSKSKSIPLAKKSTGKKDEVPLRLRTLLFENKETILSNYELTRLPPPRPVLEERAPALHKLNLQKIFAKAESKRDFDKLAHFGQEYGNVATEVAILGKNKRNAFHLYKDIEALYRGSSECATFIRLLGGWKLPIRRRVPSSGSADNFHEGPAAAHGGDDSFENINNYRSYPPYDYGPDGRYQEDFDEGLPPGDRFARSGAQETRNSASSGEREDGDTLARKKGGSSSWRSFWRYYAKA
ncbi:unnamed protein product [Amoebophrya sp. A120]|nr:unnamed protein product [Amoebophrya sp. A120]|eukprot:GSA120T00010899001.1